MKTLIINSSNYVAGSGNSYTYIFPQSVKFETGAKIGVSHIAVYNSTFNITAARGNNQVTVVFPSAATTISRTWTVPDGYYSVSDINFWLQYQCVQEGFYCTTSSGTSNVYFIECVQNSVRYAIQINSYYMPTSANATTLGYTAGIAQGTSQGWTFPTSNLTPTITFNTAFGSLLGFNAGTFPTVSQATNYSIISTKSPNISPVDSYILTCNLVNSKYSIPNDTFYSVPITGALGTLITNSPAQILFNDIASNVYNQLTIKFYDQLFNKLLMNDFDVLITLCIKEAGES